MAGSDETDTDGAKRALTVLKRKLKSKTGPGSCVVFLYARAGRERAQCWKRMKFDAPLAHNFRRDVTAALLTGLSAKDEVEPFTFDDMVSGHLGFWKKSETPELAQWFDEVPPANWQHVFEGDGAYLTKVKLHATTLPIQGASKSLTVFRHRGSGSLIHKGGVMAFFDTTEHQFKEAPGKVFHFDHGADFFEWDGWVYIFDHRRFESLTNIRSVTVSKARDCLRAINRKADIHVARIDDLNNVIATKTQLAKKLASAQMQGVTKKLTGAAMVERIKTKKLPIQFKKSGKTYTFEADPDDPAQVREFVYLVTDYYLRSPVTKIEYRVPSKYPA